MTTTRPHPALELTVEGPLARVVLDRPDQHNAQVPSLWGALAETGRTLPDSVRVVVISGNGPSFSSGLDRGLMTPGALPGELDLVSMAAWPQDRIAEQIASYQEGFAVWAQISPIVIAAVQGHAIGAGFQLALAADLRVVADDVRFAMRETSLGLVPDLGGTSPLVRLIGYARALEICLTGRAVKASEAVSIGLATLQVDAGDLEEAALDLADAILSNPAPAVRELKSLLRSAQETTPVQQRYAERTAQARLLTGLLGRG